MFHYKEPGLFLVFLALLFLVGCQNMYQFSSTEEGRLRINITDAPVDSLDISGVYVTVSGIEVNHNGQWVTWKVLDHPMTYNLSQLREGKSALLGNSTLPAGEYGQIRFVLDTGGSDQITSENSGCYVELTSGEKKPLFIPSGVNTGYKATGTFTVPINGIVDITADFDLRKSLTKTGTKIAGNERYILKPTIRLIVNNQAGDIKGSVQGINSYSDLVIYAYRVNTFDLSQVSANNLLFSDSINSAKVNDDMTFVIPFLEEGTYDLIVAGYNGTEFGVVLGYVTDVPVGAKSTTMKYLNLQNLTGF
ncbi:MAG: hypothetical protein A2X42_05370 [Candidatus Margulisbacteria bacterium GWF2_38_17]|nr:MAG: hypothetical protein A2X42_05370 [Candidatus Margulisbacteria bacterium GWF2_38_17]